MWEVEKQRGGEVKMPQTLTTLLPSLCLPLSPSSSRKCCRWLSRCYSMLRKQELIPISKFTVVENARTVTCPYFILINKQHSAGNWKQNPMNKYVCTDRHTMRSAIKVYSAQLSTFPTCWNSSEESVKQKFRCLQTNQHVLVTVSCIQIHD